jgi:hypothetical protein
MNSSSKNKTTRTKKREKERATEEIEKKENMYIIICPDERLVLKRTIRVKGRII